MFDEESNKLIAKRIEKTPVMKDQFDGFAHDPSAIRDCIYRLLKKVVVDIGDASDVVSLSVASFGEEIVLLDKDKEPIGNSLVWYDNRGKEEAEEFLTEETLPLFNGNKVDSSFSIFKLLWMKKYRPTDLEKSVSVVDMGSYIVGSLCGNYVMDWSHASRTGVFDIFTRSWNHSVMEAAELEYTMLPPLVPSGSVVGTIKKDISQELGLPNTMALVSGAHDHLCAAFASGVRKKGDLFISAGTSEAHLVLTEDPINTSTISYPIDQGCFVDDKSYYIMSSLPSGHVFKQWRQLLYKNVDENTIYEEISQVPVGSEGVLFHLSEDLKQESLQGMSYSTNRAVLLHAIMEGLAWKSKEVSQVLSDLNGEHYEKVIVAGHPTKVELWKEMKATALEKDLTIIHEVESTALGAALLAQKPFIHCKEQHIAEFSKYQNSIEIMNG